MIAQGDFADQPAGQQDTLLRAALAAQMRENTYDSATGGITVSANRALARPTTPWTCGVTTPSPSTPS
jgi:hypothetical protein